ncbi:MAG: HNH endonuclease signature motif containing protein [Planctomycetota bacterium]
MIEHKHFISALGHTYGGRTRSLDLLVSMFRSVFEQLTNGITGDDIEASLLRESPSIALKSAAEKREPSRRSKFSSDDKSASFLQQAMDSPNRCNICGARLHVRGINIDHKIRKQDGGSGSADNGQPTHPYCNSGFKESEHAKENRTRTQSLDFPN